jgi:hypothetical protein
MIYEDVILHFFRYQRVVALFLVLGVGIALGAMSHPAAAQNAKAFELRQGVIVDPGRNLAYVMNTKGGIDAVELAGGTGVWSTEQAAKPLALAGDLLIGQAESTGARRILQIVALDTKQRGKQIVTGTIELPEGVQVSIDETLGSAFVASAYIHAGDVIISWKHSRFYMKGIPPEDAEMPGKEAPPEPATAAPRTSSGTLRMNLSTGAIVPVKTEEVPPAPVPPPPDLTEKERLPGVSGPQFRSADGRHILSSERVADDRVWEKYVWTIYDRGTAERLGEIRSHMSLASFFLHDSVLIYETGPSLRRTEKGLIDEPLKLRAINLDSGQEVWSIEVRDTTYRGPFPP